MRRKLNAMPAVFEGKNVLLVDDSIVRGTTMSQIVEMVGPVPASTSDFRTFTIVLLLAVSQIRPLIDRGSIGL